MDLREAPQSPRGTYHPSRGNPGSRRSAAARGFISSRGGTLQHERPVSGPAEHSPLPKQLVPRHPGMRRLSLPGREPHLKLAPDPMIQASPGALARPSPTGDFAGIDNWPGDLSNPVLPPLTPDTNGAVGPNHFVQWVTPVEFFVGTTSIGVDTDGSNGRSVPWSTTAFAHGDYTLTGAATDTAGQTTSSGVPVTV